VSTRLSMGSVASKIESMRIITSVPE
jgi:hypothetical protein